MWNSVGRTPKKRVSITKAAVLLENPVGQSELDLDGLIKEVQIAFWLTRTKHQALQQAKYG